MQEKPHLYSAACNKKINSLFNVILHLKKRRMQKLFCFERGSKMFALTCPLLLFTSFAFTQPLKVGVAGLNHDHAYGLMNQYKNGEVIIIGIAEPDQQLAQRYRERFQLPDSIFYKSISEMLEHVKPDAVLAYNAIADHLSVVEACPPNGISVMVEKPLATTVAQAERIAALAKQYHIQVLTNYETTWYPSNQQVYKMIHAQQAIEDIRKMVVHDGHQGPKE